ncbi:GT4 family glycosyltransferase PelF [Persephonella sp.]
MGFYIKKSEDVDILILAEGTFPYIKGGVSTWIYQLITGLKEFKFGIVFLGSRPEDYGEIQYKLPDNLVHFEVHYLFAEEEKPPVRESKADEVAFKYVSELHNWFKSNHTGVLPEYIKKLDFYIKSIPEEVFLYSERSWNFILENYYENSPDQSFIDYFWTVRNIHMPIWVIAKLAKQLKNYKVIHSPSTGYAGFLGALMHFDTGKPFILTEHGIYTRERKIDLLNADWIEDKRTILQKELGELDYLKTMWVRFFEGLGRFIYTAADPIISLFDKAREIQISYGAPPEKTMIIPNGVDIERLGKLIEKREEEIPKVITLIGRVVPIKDIKTFIKAIRIVANHIPDIEGWIVGPEDEDPDYARECHFLVETLGLKRNIKFLGFQKIDDILPKTGIVTLTSISEGMPLVVIEGFAAGVPAVTTNVGSCYQLIYGGIDEEDKKLGKAGEVVPIANPSKLADTYLKILTDEKLWKSCQDTALKRVRKYYSMETFLGSYRSIYMEAVEKWQVLALS